jgi:hypothetical protein
MQALAQNGGSNRLAEMARAKLRKKIRNYA